MRDCVISEKKHTGGGVAEGMEFLNKMCKLKESRKGIHRDDQEKIMWNFHESWI